MLKETRFRLRRAVKFFGVDRPLTTIRPKDVRQWLTRFLHLSTSNQRHHLHALSGLYGYAQEMEVVPSDTIPSRGFTASPPSSRHASERRSSSRIDEAARFLDAARRLDLHHELIATYLLTGGRRSEVFGLVVNDLDFGNTSSGFSPIRIEGSSEYGVSEQCRYGLSLARSFGPTWMGWTDQEISCCSPAKRGR